MTLLVAVSPPPWKQLLSNLLGGFLYDNISKASPQRVDAGLVACTACVGILFLKEPRERAG